MTPDGYLRLILTRHAKSAWDDPGLSDHDRHLNDRGRRAAVELGDWLASRGYDPEQVLVSSAARTQETWALVQTAALETLPKVQVEEEMYNASADTLLKVLATADAPTVMMIAHNPGIAELASRLPATPPMTQDFRNYPTASTLVVDFHAKDWASIQPGKGNARDFVRFDGRR